MPVQRPMSNGAALVAALLAGGCSTLVDVAGLPRAGVQSDGSYVLTEAESGLDCRALAERIDLALSDMRKHAEKIESERRQLPRTVQGMIGRTFGGPDGGLTSAAKFRQGEVRVRALSAEGRRKSCTGSDAASLEARIADALSAPPDKAAAEAQSRQQAPAGQTLFGAPVSAMTER